MIQLQIHSCDAEHELNNDSVAEKLSAVAVGDVIRQYDN